MEVVPLAACAAPPVPSMPGAAEAADKSAAPRTCFSSTDVLAASAVIEIDDVFVASTRAARDATAAGAEAPAMASEVAASAPSPGAVAGPAAAA